MSKTFLNDNLILLKRGSGDKSIVFIHDGGGEVIQYINFCKYIGKEYSVYGIRYDVNIMTYAPKVHDISKIADTYLRYLEESGVKNLYLILGYCIGGKIAYEMCRKLKDSSPQYLVLLNAIPPNQKRDENNFTLEDEKRFFKKNNVPYIIRKSKIHNTEQLWENFSSYLDRHRLIFLLVKKMMPKYMKNLINKLQIENDGKEVVKYLNLVRGFEETHFRYSVPEEKLNVTLYYFNALYEEVINYKYWSELAKEAVFTDIKSDHIGLIYPKNVEDMVNNTLKQIFADSLA